MPTPASCVDCMEEGPVAPPVRWKKIGGTFSAAYPGQCPAGDPIEPGDLVQRWDLGSERTAYVHDDCGVPA
jgi:hypothetical protein